MTGQPTTAAEATPPDLGTARRTLLLALADDELITGHRASHWTGVAPSIEEDLAFSTIAQDEINHADVWYQVLLTGDGAMSREAVDALGLGREPDEYRHAVICERPPRDFAYTLARHWLYDHADAVRLEALSQSSDGDVAAVARKLAHEERYHLEHADLWFRRLTRGGPEAAQRFRDALAAALPEALWMFEPLPGEDVLVAAGVLPEFSGSLVTRWLEHVAEQLTGAGIGDVLDGVVARGGGWVLPHDQFAVPGGRHGVHTADFTEDVWPEMTGLYRAHPGAAW